MTVTASTFNRAPVADVPVRKIIAAHHFVADLTLPYGRVIYDYNKEP